MTAGSVQATRIFGSIVFLGMAFLSACKESGGIVATTARALTEAVTVVPPSPAVETGEPTRPHNRCEPPGPRPPPQGPIQFKPRFPPPMKAMDVKKMMEARGIVVSHQPPPPPVDAETRRRYERFRAEEARQIAAWSALPPEVRARKRGELKRQIIIAGK